MLLPLGQNIGIQLTPLFSPPTCHCQQLLSPLPLDMNRPHGPTHSPAPQPPACSVVPAPALPVCPSHQGARPGLCLLPHSDAGPHSGWHPSLAYALVPNATDQSWNPLRTLPEPTQNSSRTHSELPQNPLRTLLEPTQNSSRTYSELLEPTQNFPRTHSELP